QIRRGLEETGGRKVEVHRGHVQLGSASYSCRRTEEVTQRTRRMGSDTGVRGPSRWLHRPGGLIRITPMAKTFGFNDDELKLLLVAVRQMRRTFAEARKSDESIESYAALYDDLYEKLRDMAGPLPEKMDELL